MRSRSLRVQSKLEISVQSKRPDGDPHPQYSTLKVCALNPDGSAAAYRPTVWYRDGDPRVVSLTNAKALYARLRQIRNDEVSCKLGTQDRSGAAQESLVNL